ncbi:hypothetical protein V2G26_004067 [Clonostachys chloroleuca]
MIEQEMQALVSSAVRTPSFWVWGRHLFRIRQDNVNERGILERCARVNDTSPKEDDWKVVIDIDELGRKENRVFEFHSHMECCLFGPDADRLLLMLSDGGSDLVELREIDARTGQLIDGGFHTPSGRITVSWLDIDHLLISHTIYGGPKTAGDWPAASYIWQRGSDLKNVKAVFTAEPTDAIAGVCSLGPTDSGRAIINRVVDFSTFIYYIVSLDGSVEELPGLPTGSSMVLPRPTASEYLFISLSKETVVRGKAVPAGSLIAYNVSTDQPGEERLSIVYEPEEEEVNLHLWINGLRASNSRIHFAMSKRGAEKKMVFENQNGEWQLVHSVPTSTGSRVTIVAADCYSDDTIICESGLLCPSTYWLEDEEGKKTLLYAEKPAFDASEFILRQMTTNSEDGTEIDYLVLSPRVPKHDQGKAPVLMTGYGAYGISMPTSYLNSMLGGVSLVPWLNSGGSLVIPFIRGGGERGEAWHQAARQEKRQKSYDDFIAVAETIVRDGFTTPKHLGVYGSSSGGLLSAIMCIQRPKLFGAVVSDVPLTDMLRYTLMGMGGAWIYEHGDPKDPEMAKVLRAYSPFHNIQDRMNYPPCLVTISTNDDRVGPGHGRKFAAKIKDAGASNFYFFEDDSGGHSVSDSFKNTKLLVRRLVFFIETLQ